MSDLRLIFDFLADYEDLLWDYIIGVMFWAVAAMLPFRRILANKEVFWNIMGVRDSA